MVERAMCDLQRERTRGAVMSTKDKSCLGIEHLLMTRVEADTRKCPHRDLSSVRTNVRYGYDLDLFRLDEAEILRRVTFLCDKTIPHQRTTKWPVHYGTL